MLQCHSVGVGFEVGDRVVVDWVPLVPVVGDGFVTGGVFEGAGGVAGDGEEGFEHVTG